jgi:hypothetical protein
MNKRILTLTLTAGILILVACTGGDPEEPQVTVTATAATNAPATVAATNTPVVVASATSDVATLTERVEDALALASRGNWLEAWEYYTLSFKESCPRETFAAQAASGMNLFRGMLELPVDEPLGFRLMSLTVNGTTALVSTHIIH